MVEKKIVVVHAGKRDDYQVALALEEGNLLEFLVTDMYWPLDNKVCNYFMSLMGLNKIGEKNFKNYATRAALLNKLGKTADADAAMKMAMPMATMQELHAYGRQLLQQKRAKEALEVFKMNAQKNPNQLTTYMGLARGYSANGDYANALKNAQLAQPLAQGAQKEAIDKMIATLKAGKDIN